MVKPVTTPILADDKEHKLREKVLFDISVGKGDLDLERELQICRKTGYWDEKLGHFLIVKIKATPKARDKSPVNPSKNENIAPNREAITMVVIGLLITYALSINPIRAEQKLADKATPIF